MVHVHFLKNQKPKNPKMSKEEKRNHRDGTKALEGYLEYINSIATKCQPLELQRFRQVAEEEIAMNLCLEKAKVVTHQCSYCTGASAICSVRPWKLCIDCKSIFVHLCQNCSNKSHLRTCYLCTPRKHTCLSKCHRGCVLELNNQPKATPVSKKISSPLNFFPATTKNLH